MCTNSFNNPDEFVEMRSVLVEQGLMPEDEIHKSIAIDVWGLYILAVYMLPCMISRK